MPPRLPFEGLGQDHRVKRNGQGLSYGFNKARSIRNTQIVRPSVLVRGATVHTIQQDVNLVKEDDVNTVFKNGSRIIMLKDVAGAIVRHWLFFHFEFAFAQNQLTDFFLNYEDLKAINNVAVDTSFAVDIAFHLIAIADDWDPDTLTWSNKPGLSTGTAITFSSTMAASGSATIVTKSGGEELRFGRVSIPIVGGGSNQFAGFAVNIVETGPSGNDPDYTITSEYKDATIVSK